MDTATFIKVLDLEKTHRIECLGDIFNNLQKIPNSFVALNWHSSHEFLYISENVVSMTGYPYKNFHKHGIIFLYSVTPPEMIEEISSSIVKQLSALEKNPMLITQPVTLAIDGVIKHRKSHRVPIRCVSTILDFLPGQRRSYLIFSSYIDMENAGSALENLTEEAVTQQNLLHKIYMEMNPNRFRVFDSFKLLTPREIEIADLIRTGHNSKSIADKLSIALYTVTSHRKSLMKKMEAGNTAEMVHMLNQID